MQEGREQRHDVRVALPPRDLRLAYHHVLRAGRAVRHSQRRLPLQASACCAPNAPCMEHQRAPPPCASEFHHLPRPTRSQACQAVIIEAAWQRVMCRCLPYTSRPAMAHRVQQDRASARCRAPAPALPRRHSLIRLAPQRTRSTSCRSSSMTFTATSHASGRQSARQTCAARAPLTGAPADGAGPAAGELPGRRRPLAMGSLSVVW